MSDQFSLDYEENDRSETFEQGFERAARSAASVAKVGAQITGAAREMQKAAVEGDIAKIRRALHSPWRGHRYCSARTLQCEGRLALLRRSATGVYELALFR